MTESNPPAPSAAARGPLLDLQLVDHDEQYGEAPNPAARFARLQSAAELRVALLALLLPGPSRRALAAWQHECAATPGAELLREFAQQLPAADRLPWFDTLLARMRGQALSERQALVASTRQVLGARGSVRPIDRLHWLLMRRKLGDTPAASPQPATTHDLSQLPDKDVAAIARYSAFLSRLVPFEPADASPGAFAPGIAWYAQVMAPWAQRWSIPPCEPPASDALTQALQELQALPWMLRPSLVRNWVTTALAASPEGKLSRSAADALRLSCALLDSPLPPELARHFGADPEERRA